MILGNEPDIVNTELNVLSKQLSIKPFESWSISQPAQSLSWWQSFDNLKHSRTANFTESSLKNTLYILGALFILESKYLVRIVDSSCEPDIPDEESHLFCFKIPINKVNSMNKVFMYPV